jgi:CDGSH-type Zn-finger protein
MIAWIFLFVVLAGVAKLIYDVQKKKKEATQMYGFDKEAFQKLAGIKPINENDELRQILVKNNFPKEEIADALLKAAVNGDFPKSDDSINVKTTKIGTIDTNFHKDKDPLESVPMSRVSTEAKQKMAEIAKEDINTQLEKNVERFEALNVGLKACGCGRSETGFCTGLHMIPKKDWANGVREIPAPKKKANPKQSVKEGYTESAPFVKTKRKYTKKPKA